MEDEKDSSLSQPKKANWGGARQGAGRPKGSIDKVTVRYILENAEKVNDIKDAYFLKDGMGRYSLNNQTIKFGPGLHQHQWTQLRGAEDKLDAMSVYLTGFTPFKWKLKIF